MVEKLRKLKRAGKNQNEMALALGVSQQYISRILPLLDIPLKIRRQLYEGKISVKQALRK